SCAMPVSSVHSSQSMFDNSRDLVVDPASTWCGMRMSPCIQMGAAWKSTYPSSITLDMQIQWEYVSIIGASLNIDGVKHVLPEPTLTTRFTNAAPGSIYSHNLRRSDQTFSIPIALVRQLLNAKDV